MRFLLFALWTADWFRKKLSECFERFFLVLCAVFHLYLWYFWYFVIEPRCPFERETAPCPRPFFYIVWYYHARCTQCNFNDNMMIASNHSFFSTRHISANYSDFVRTMMASWNHSSLSINWQEKSPIIDKSFAV